MVKIPNSLIGL